METAKTGEAHDKSETRAESDLRAQQSMANSAVEMLGLTRVQILLGVIGAVGLLVSLELTRRSLQLTRDSVKVAQESMTLTRQAVEDDRAALDIARESLKLQSEMSARQLRAYLDVNTKPAKNFQVGLYPKAEIIVINTGQTPAHQVSIRSDLRWSRAGYPPPSYDDCAQEETGSTLVIGAGEKMFHHVEIGTPLTQADLNDINNGKLELVFFGIISYRDIFDAEQAYRFCRLYFGSEDNDWAIGPLPNEMT